MKKVTLFFAFTLSVLIGFGQSVSISNAKKLAKNHYLQHESALLKKKIIDISFSGEYVVKNITDTLYYIFNVANNKGFVIISADQRAYPIIGYSFRGTYSETDQPPAFLEWIENRKQELIHVKASSLPANNSITSEWNALNAISPGKETLTTGPLLQTTWNQDCYYNALCPADAAGPCGHVYTGCVATSMAQIMKYWSFPGKGTGSHSYSHLVYGTLSANFGATRYNWSNMPNQINEDNPDIATLMFHCGVSVDMDYSPSGSTAYDPRLALINYFYYSPGAQYLLKSNYSDSGWEDIIKAEIDSLRPIWYRGDGSGGHAFVCDGYQNTNYFHFNWGWNGQYDGYYYLSSLNPGARKYTNNQGAIINIHPSFAFTSAATDIGFTNAILHGIVLPNKLATNVSFEYGTTTSYGNAIMAFQSTINGDSAVVVDANLSGLFSNTTYHFRVKAINSAGTFYGNDYAFSTKSDIWIQQVSGTSNNLKSVFFANSNIGYAGGDGGKILKTIDGGVTWSPLNSGIAYNITGVFFINQDTGWAVTDIGKIIKTTNGGSTWTVKYPTVWSLYSVFFIDANKGWAGSDGEILKTSNGGTTWSPVSLQSGTSPIRSIFFTSSTDGWAAGSYNVMLGTNDGGSSWHGVSTTPSSAGLAGVHFAHDNTGFSCGYGGSVYKKISSESVWNKLTSDSNNDLHSIYFTDSVTGFTVGSYGTILQTLNGGTGWIHSYSGTTNNLNSVFFTDKYNGWVVGDGGTILHTNTGGKPGITVNLKVLLEGPLNSSTGVMNCNINSYIPNFQPFNAAPWNYSGTETLSAVPADAVDWVLLELRQADSPDLATSSTILAKRAAILKSNGSVVDLDGTSPVNFANCTVTESNNLYIVMRHRNHLAIMSATGAILNSGVYSYDFTTSLSQVYGGGSGYKQVGSTVAMVSGDVDKDGNIFVSDFNNWATGFGSTNGYLNSDFDMDGNAFVSDYNKWAVNFGSQADNNLKSAQINSDQIKSKYSSMVPK